MLRAEPRRPEPGHASAADALAIISNGQTQGYLLLPDVVEKHRSAKTVVQVPV